MTTPPVHRSANDLRHISHRLSEIEDGLERLRFCYLVYQDSKTGAWSETGKAMLGQQGAERQLMEAIEHLLAQ